MKVSQLIRVALAPLALPSVVVAFAPSPRSTLIETSLFSREDPSRDIMSNMDMMCITNAADICSYYDECDIEEREAIFNRFEEQSELLADRLATMQALSMHLKTGDHKHLEEDEVARLKRKIISATGGVGVANVEYLDGMEAGNL
mmetsp:Transcript_15247/g.22332  ORF Transcript_15247/g.22332 Transcript_15247/m.22332 type:complete len:145 (+) Transcript_15247:55-489(+)